MMLNGLDRLKKGPSPHSVNLIFVSFFHVLLLSLLMAFVVSLGVFDSVAVDSGLQHYAELPYWGTNSFPYWLPMPANTIVNVGYLVVGITWMVRTYRDLQQRNAYFFYVFSHMSVLYGLVQFTRIVTQSHRMGVLDQWYTLPIFAWVIVWSINAMQSISLLLILAIELVSIASYCLSLFFTYGFEMALGAHILSVLSFAVVVYRKFNASITRKYFYNAIVCCVGFVLLKLLDHWLVGKWFIFAYLSGHFWSKIADFLQIHFVCLFFINCRYK